MKMMHVKLPEFLKMLKSAAAQGDKVAQCDITGLESFKIGKAQSARTGVLQLEIEELVSREGVAKIKIDIVPRVPETMHTVVIRALDENDQPLHAILNSIDILHPTVDLLVHDCPNIEDRRPPVGSQ